MIVELLIVVGVLVGVGIILFSWLVGSYNTFVLAKQDIDNMWSNIKTEYQRRADLFMNLVETVKGYARFEKSTLVDVISARAGKFGANFKDEIKKMGDLEKTFSKLMMLVEKYPDLKAEKHYSVLMGDIKETEDRINVARTDYNSLARDYNVLIKSFPKNLIASHFGFKNAFYFENEAMSNAAPKIDMKL